MERMREEAEKEASQQVDMAALEKKAIEELLVPMRLQVREVIKQNVWYGTNEILNTWYQITADGHWYTLTSDIKCGSGAGYWKFAFSLYNAVADQLSQRYHETVRTILGGNEIDISFGRYVS